MARNAQSVNLSRGGPGRSTLRLSRLRGSEQDQLYNAGVVLRPARVSDPSLPRKRAGERVTNRAVKSQHGQSVEKEIVIQ
jgi:hypothetical protein